jgi:integrase
MKKREAEGFEVDYTFSLEFDERGAIRKLDVDAQPHEMDAVSANIKAAMEGRQQPARPIPAVPALSPSDLLEDYFREGIGSNRWKNPLNTRKHDYDPIWAKFSVHAEVHGLTVAATKAYRAEVLDQEVALQTKVRNLSRIHSVITHGVEQHGLDEKMLTPLKGTKLKSRAKKGNANIYLPFTTDELVCLFHSEQYRDNTFKKPSHYWLPLLGLYTGARLEELAGLHLSSFSTSEGTSVVSLSEEETTDGGKNEFALRQVPIHRELINAGLISYVETLRLQGNTRLFPDIGKSARDGYGKRATVDFTEYRRSVGVGKDAGERSRQVFHSFRATLAGQFYHHGIDGDLSRRLIGHAAIDIHQGTYLGAAAIPIARATVAMDSISFDLSHPPFVDTDAFKRSRNRKRAATEA